MGNNHYRNIYHDVSSGIRVTLIAEVKPPGTDVLSNLW